jgi:chemotaxis protein methyltransferase CheR
MTPDDFAFLARLLRRRSGLSLTSDKLSLVESRVETVMRRFDFRDMAALIRELRLGRESLAESVTEAMTVNETSFFRDAGLFQRLRDRVMPHLLQARGHCKRLRIWSAATASGQEAYSIAILLSELGLAREGWTVDLIATDLSAQAIARAEQGRYAACEVERGLDESLLARHFRKHGKDWVVGDALRRLVTFRRFNLLDSFGWLDDLDLVFCRNVLMYFDAVTRAGILERMSDCMAADGVLLLGENEVPDIAAFKHGPDGPGFYVKSRASFTRLLDQRFTA